MRYIGEKYQEERRGLAADSRKRDRRERDREERDDDDRRRHRRNRDHRPSFKDVDTPNLFKVPNTPSSSKWDDDFDGQQRHGSKSQWECETPITDSRDGVWRLEKDQRRKHRFILSNIHHHNKIINYVIV